MERKRIRSLTRERIVYPLAIYHITNRAPGKESLFLEESDYLHMLLIIKEISNKFSWKIFCFCIMPNHLHLLIQIKEENLSQGAKNLFERYADYFNRKYQRKGPVFCRPFRARICVDDSYLLVASMYIHINPFKAGLVNRPENYRWSSLGLYIEKDVPHTFVDYKFILSILDENIAIAKDLYSRMIQNSIKVEYKNIFQDRHAVDKFKLDIIRSYCFSHLLKKVRKRNSFLLWEELEKFFNAMEKKNLKDFKAKRYLVEQLLANGYKISEISTFLGVSRQILYRWLTK